MSTTDWGYVIKEVWGYSETHTVLHFKKRGDAEKIAHHGQDVVLYETSRRGTEASMCVFGLGRVAKRQFAVVNHRSDGEVFPYGVPFAPEFELPANSRGLGIPHDDVEEIVGRNLGWYSSGGLIRLDGLEFKRVEAVLRQRYQECLSAGECS